MSESISGRITFEDKKKVFKVIVTGDRNVGKTCLTSRFYAGKFPSSTETTIGVNFGEKEIVLDNGQCIKLQIWDTAGEERFREGLMPHYYRDVHAVIFVYDMTKIDSFRNLPKWIDECKDNHKGKFEDIPRIIVGNKCDCINEIAVNKQMAKKFADDHNMPLLETSAKDDNHADRVEEIFKMIAYKLKDYKSMVMMVTPTIKLDASPPQNSSSCCCS